MASPDPLVNLLIVLLQMVEFNKLIILEITVLAIPTGLHDVA